MVWVQIHIIAAVNLMAIPALGEGHGLKTAEILNTVDEFNTPIEILHVFHTEMKTVSFSNQLPVCHWSNCEPHWTSTVHFKPSAVAQLLASVVLRYTLLPMLHLSVHEFGMQYDDCQCPTLWRVQCGPCVSASRAGLLAADGVSAGQRTLPWSSALCSSGVMLWESAGLLQRSG